jgi:hypothetical protein
LKVSDVPTSEELIQKPYLKRHRSIWEGDQEVVKRSGRDELIGVVVHLYMEAMLEISL